MGWLGRVVCVLWLVGRIATAENVSLNSDHLLVQGAPAPYLYGAELQYFRARGGAERNVPAKEVHRLWSKLLDRVTEARMNSVIFYIPWDFHEPEEGVFDFDGTLDRDGDGKPDYPSRNVKLFLRMVAARGIKHIMVRPGPYINAEWGPTGFGAIPLWFLNKYKKALSLRPAEVLAKTEVERAAEEKKKPKVASFGHPLYREKAKAWFAELHRQVLKDWIGPQKPVLFLQIDNETNYFWDSVYERDWNPISLERYRSFLQSRYRSNLAELNKAYGAEFAGFQTISPPRAKTDTSLPGSAWHYDWYLFHDQEIDDYYRFLRGTWETLGVKSPDVLFTNCDSFNALDFGLLPRLDRQKNQLTLSTMNVYPKTQGTQNDSTLNTPFKAAHDATLIGASHRQFYGQGGGWVMSSETVGGWFPPVQVSFATRQHTYGSLLGSGIKALMIYYFHEGWNWTGLEATDSELKFDAPLDVNLDPHPARDPKTEPRNTFELVKSLGLVLSTGLGEKLVASRPVTSPILIAHDNTDQYPIPHGPDTLNVVSTDSAALFGLLRETGNLPELGFVDAMDDEALQRYRVVIWQDRGSLSAETRQKLDRFVRSGGWLLLIGGPPPQKENPRAIHFATNPAAGWNADAYARLESAPRQLNEMKNLLEKAGIVAPLKVIAEDNKPFLHAWLRHSTQNGNPLLFVENFSRGVRAARVSIRPNEASAKTHRLVPIWTASAVTREPIVSTTLTTEGVSLPVSSDGVDIWELVPQR